MTTITLSVSDDLARRINIVSDESHRTVSGIVLICILNHLPKLEEAAAHMSAFRVPGQDPASVPAGPPEPKPEDPEKPKRYRSPNKDHGEPSQFATKVAKFIEESGHTPSVGFLGALMARIRPDLSLSQICREMATSKGNVGAVSRCHSNREIAPELDRLTKVYRERNDP